MAGMDTKWRVCDFCGGDGVRTVEWNTHGEATCGTCRGTGRVPKQTAMPHMLTVAREWLQAENERLASSGETVYAGHPAHIVAWLIQEVQRLRRSNPPEVK